MSQVLITPDVISKEILMILHNSLTFTKHVNREFDKMFANSGVTVSGKIGPTLRVRKPARFTVTDGAALAVQDITEEYVTVPVSTREHVGMRFSSQDLTLTVDDFSKRYLEPAAKVLAAKIDRDGLAMAAKATYAQVGTPGTTPATALTYLQAGSKLDSYLAPRDNQRTACISPDAQAATVNGLTNLFNKQELIGAQYETGTMGYALGAMFVLDQQIPSLTAGDRTTSGETHVEGEQDGASILMTTGSTTTFNAGDRFTIAGVYQVNPESKVTTGNLQQFIVTADATAISTAVTLAIAPEIIVSGPRQTVNAKAANSAAVVFISGDKTTTNPQNLLYHKDAFTLACADLYLPEGVDMRSRTSSDGLSVRIVRDYVINTDDLVCRADVLYGWAPLYPQWSCVVVG
jgi:hypothetical protein